MEASIIIPTRNRCELLRKCLLAIEKQTISKSDYEVIVIDNGSIDQTKEVIQAFSDILPIRYFYMCEPGLHVGRHVGILQSKSDILIYGDDDIEPLPTWLNSIVKTFKDFDVALVGGNNYAKFEVPPPAWLKQWWETPCYRGRALSYLSILDFGKGCFDLDPYYVWGCNFAIRKKVLLKARGFHPDGFPKEKIRYRGDGETYVSAFVKQSGLRTVFNSGASVFHWVSNERMTVEHLCMQAYKAGISDSYSHLRNRNGRSKFLLSTRQMLSQLVRSSKQTVAKHIGNRDPVIQELQSIRAKMGKFYQEGYRFHHDRVAQDPDLRSWVLRETYL